MRILMSISPIPFLAAWRKATIKRLLIIHERFYIMIVSLLSLTFHNPISQTGSFYKSLITALLRY